MRTSRITAVISCLIVAFVATQSGCSKSATEPDTTAPTPGSSGMITFLQVQGDSVLVVWAPATDDRTDQEILEYKLVRSTQPDIVTVSDAEANGTTVLDWAEDTVSVTDRGLLPETAYFYNVLVRDETANAAAYIMAELGTPDGTPPVPGNSGTLTDSDLEFTSVSLTWAQATDNLSSWTDLRYKVFQSLSSDISTVSDALANGTTVMDWTTDLTSAVADGLAPSTDYYFNVIVQDEADNMAAYTMLSGHSRYEKFYLVDANQLRVYRGRLDGSHFESQLAGMASGSYGIALDLTEGKMYWTCYSANIIQRSNLDGTGMETFLGGVSSPMGIALDTDAGYVYWTSLNGNMIYRAPISGGGPVGLVGGLVDPWGIALDLVNGKMYWADRSAGKIQRANLDGTSLQDVVVGLPGPYGIAVDALNGKLYWSDTSADKIQRSNLDGTLAEDLVTAADGIVNIYGIALDIEAGKIYWVDETNDKVQCADLDGSNIVDLIDHTITYAMDIALALYP